MKEYDVFIPLCYNDGTPVEPFRFQNLQARLLEHFDGLTYFPQQLKKDFQQEEILIIEREVGLL